MSTLDLAAAPTALAVPGQRGRTVIADRVVAQVATRAVAEVAQTGGAARQLIGFTLGRQTGQGSARVSARVDGNLALIEIRLTLAYPAPVRSLSREVRLPKKRHFVVPMCAHSQRDVDEHDDEPVAEQDILRSGRQHSRDAQRLPARDQ